MTLNTDGRLAAVAAAVGAPPQQPPCTAASLAAGPQPEPPLLAAIKVGQPRRDGTGNLALYLTFLLEPTCANSIQDGAQRRRHPRLAMSGSG